MWQKLKQFCLYSATIAWSYVLAIVSAVLFVVDNIGDLIGDPNLKDQIAQAIGDPKITSRLLLFIAVVNILARLRSLRKVQ